MLKKTVGVGKGAVSVRARSLQACDSIVGYSCLAATNVRVGQDFAKKKEKIYMAVSKRCGRGVLCKRAVRDTGALLSLCQHHQKTHTLTLTLRTHHMLIEVQFRRVVAVQEH
jgi:hypothetical protein